MQEQNPPPWYQPHLKSKNTLKRERQQARVDAYEEERDRLAAEKAEKYRGWSATDRAVDELAEQVGSEAAEKVKALIAAMIYADKPPYDGG